MKNMNLLIVAAGKGSRMGNVSIPKALADVGGKPNLINTIEKLDEHFDRIFVAVNALQFDVFKESLRHWCCYDKVTLFVISSGLGSGHATLNAMRGVSGDTPLVLTWGDVYFDNDALVCELTQQAIQQSFYTDGPLVIPCALEKQPYLSVCVDAQMFATGINLKPTAPGFHDQSVFLCTNVDAFIQILTSMHNALWNIDHYITENGEFGFLQVVSYMYNMNKPARMYPTDNTLLGYNTPEELAKIIATK